MQNLNIRKNQSYLKVHSENETFPSVLQTEYCSFTAGEMRPHQVFPNIERRYL